MRCHYLQSLSFEFIKFLLCVNNVLTALTTEIHTIDRFATAELITPGADLSRHACFAQIRSPETIWDKASSYLLLALGTMHLSNRICDKEIAIELYDSGILAL